MEQQIINKLSDPNTRNYGFNLLINEYQERVYWHVRKMVIDHEDANDLTQEIFVKVWKNIEQFRHDSKLYTWIYRIATNETLNYLKKQKRKAFFSLNNYEEILENKLVTNEHINGDEIEIKLQKALLRLPNKQRLVFNMRYFDEMKFEEISEITGTSTGALKANYHHAVKKIEEFIITD